MVVFPLLLPAFLIFTTYCLLFLFTAIATTFGVLFFLISNAFYQLFCINTITGTLYSLFLVDYY